MASLSFITCFATILFFANPEFTGTKASNTVPFDTNYRKDWGNVNVLDHGTEVQLLIDSHSGGGFVAKQMYGSGRLRASIKLPKSTKGLITAFYLTSDRNSDHPHDEIDFELFGGDHMPYRLQTNLFSQDHGHREQIIHLWFDPTQAFHDYEILWTPEQIVFFADGKPIRVLKNNKKYGVRYPIGSPMYLQASLWNKTDWLGEVDWSKEPYVSSFRGFEITGCPYDYSNPAKCYAKSYEWNKNWKLTAKQQKVYEEIQRKALVYDYCKSTGKSKFPECKVN